MTDHPLKKQLDQDGKPLTGIKATVKRGTGRAGGYTIDVTGPAPARLMLPKGTGE